MTQANPAKLDAFLARLATVYAEDGARIVMRIKCEMIAAHERGRNEMREDMVRVPPLRVGTYEDGRTVWRTVPVDSRADLRDLVMTATRHAVGDPVDWYMADAEADEIIAAWLRR